MLLPRGHRLAPAAALSPAAIAGAAFVDGPAGFGHRVVSDRLFAAAGLARTVRIEIADLPSLAARVAAGLGVAVVPAEPVEAHPEVVAVPPTDPVRWQVSLATRAEPSSAAAAFVRAAVAPPRAVTSTA